MPEQPRNPRQPMGIPIASAAILCLFLMRFFMVAESAAIGESLWIVGLWLAVLVFWVAISWRSQNVIVGWLDLCVGLLVTGQIVSAVRVLATSGDKRSALNLVWEWVGIAVAWFLLRQQTRQTAFRRELIAGLIATGTTVAALGLYQHYVDFPQMAAKYGPLFDRLKHADAAEAASIRQMLARDHIPVDGASLILFEKRLRDSREPLGLFALANTLGGFLAVCMVLSISISESQWRMTDGKAGHRIWSWVTIVSILALCLVLTKSRTAWIGTATGLAFWSIGTGFTKLNRIQLRVLAGVLVITVLIGWGLFHFGGLDRQVLTEAPKSLQYRLQYWTATWRMIKDHPLLGVGPGQFRANYLFYKLPEASEEISDPHNLFLDAAANGGIVALAGLVAFCVTIVSKTRSNLDETDGLEARLVNLVVPYVVSGIAAVVWVAVLLSGQDDRLLVILPVAIALTWGIRQLIARIPQSTKAIELGSVSAAIALLVHLMGAGGIGMPAVTLLLLALAAVAAGSTRSRFIFPLRKSLLLPATLVFLGLGLQIPLFLTGLRPVWVAFNHISTGDRFAGRGQMEAADAEYTAAADADPLSYEPWQRRAELAYLRADTEQFRSNDSFQTAVRLMRESSLRDPINFQQDLRLGNWWLARWQITNQSTDAHEAVAAYQRAWRRYPTNARLMSDLAFALSATGAMAEAATFAESATRQDDINHQWSHVDKYLPDPIRQQLDRLLKSRTDRQKID